MQVGRRPRNQRHMRKRIGKGMRYRVSWGPGGYSEQWSQVLVGREAVCLEGIGRWEGGWTLPSLGDGRSLCVQPHQCAVWEREGLVCKSTLYRHRSGSSSPARCVSCWPNPYSELFSNPCSTQLGAKGDDARNSRSCCHCREADVMQSVQRGCESERRSRGMAVLPGLLSGALCDRPGRGATGIGGPAVSWGSLVHLLC